MRSSLERASTVADRADDFSSNRHPAPSFRLSMIFSENRLPLFRIMLELSGQTCAGGQAPVNGEDRQPRSGRSEME
jgi:hypothetical protein